MIIDWYLLGAGTLRRQPVLTAWPPGDLAGLGESWFDIRDANPDGLRAFLKLNLHPLALQRCVAPANVPGAISSGEAVLLEFPAGQGVDAPAPIYLTLVLQGPVLLTIRRDSMPAVDALARSLVADGAPPIYHLAQVVYELIDTLVDPGVQAEMTLRDQLQQVSRALAEKPRTVSATDLTRLHWRIDTLVSLIENQLYSVAALNASDNNALREPHRKAYIQDLVSELELAQRGVERLEARGNDLDAAFQLASSSRVERRLRILTVISAVTLPLGLLAGLLGMNVGGVPGMADSNGFAIVVLLMATIVAAELLYFRIAGWFD